MSDLLKNLNPLEVLRTKIEAANKVGLKLQAAKSDHSAAVTAILESSTEAAIVKYREGEIKVNEQIATLQAALVNAKAKIKAHAETLIPGIEEGYDVEAESKKFAGLRAEAHATRKGILNFGISEETLNEALKEMGVAEIVSVKGHGTGKRGAPSGIKRPRISAATLDGVAVWHPKDDTKVDFGTLAKAGKSEGETLKAAAFEVAGTTDLNVLPAGTVVPFTVDGHKYTVTISGEKPMGRKPSVKEDAPAE